MGENDSNILKLGLKRCIDTAFYNEAEFLEEFWPSEHSIDLLECYMGDEQTRIVVLFDSGQSVTSCISTDKFISWVEATKNKKQKTKNKKQKTKTAVKMQKYRKKPVVIEAVQWVADNFVEVDEFIGDYPHRTFPKDGKVEIDTLEGTMLATVGDWIIKGVKGEFYPCKNDVFQATYEAV